MDTLEAELVAALKTAALHIGNYEQMVSARLSLTTGRSSALHDDIVRAQQQIRTALSAASGRAPTNKEE